MRIPYDIQQVEYIIVLYLQYYSKGVQALQPEIRINGWLHFFSLKYFHRAVDKTKKSKK